MERATSVRGRPATKRPWLAALLAFLQPGLGHLYLRAWVRALLWFLLWIATLVLVAPVSGGLDAAGLVEGLRAAVAALEGLSFAASLALFSVTAFSMLDAYWLAARTNHVEETPRCPSCNKEVDPDLGFCHWCTAEFEAPAADEERPPQS